MMLSSSHICRLNYEVIVTYDEKSKPAENSGKQKNEFNLLGKEEKPKRFFEDCDSDTSSSDEDDEKSKPAGYSGKQKNEYNLLGKGEKSKRFFEDLRDSDTSSDEDEGEEEEQTIERLSDKDENEKSNESLEELPDLDKLFSDCKRKRPRHAQASNQYNLLGKEKKPSRFFQNWDSDTSSSDEEDEKSKPAGYSGKQKNEYNLLGKEKKPSKFFQNWDSDTSSDEDDDEE
ncbi:protein starmaker-like [Palaemon carinicauda]|uniref:protein starmaker-like n=1 Tax=Palaemon carinicauda TaxID=392227 RepID=UPI0035B581DE